MFGKTGVTIDNVGKAIVAFERCLVSGPAPFDYAEKFRPFEKMDADDLADLKTDDPATYKKYTELAARKTAADVGIGQARTRFVLQPEGELHGLSRRSESGR